MVSFILLYAMHFSVKLVYLCFFFAFANILHILSHPHVISILWNFNAPVNKVYRISSLTTGSCFINLRRFSVLVVGRKWGYFKYNRSLYGSVPRWQYHILKPKVQISKVCFIVVLFQWLPSASIRSFHFSKMQYLSVSLYINVTT